VTGTGNLSIKVNTYFFQTPVRTVLLGRSAALTCRLRQKGSNVDVPGVTIAYTLGGVAIGTALTDASGVATLTYPVPTTATLGDSPITITFAGNSQYNATTGTGKLTIQAGTLIASTPDRSGSRGGNVTLTARLVQSGTFAKLAGKTLTFSIGGTVIGSATTSTDGLATLTYAIPADAAVGTTKVAVSFAGDTFYAPSAGSINLTIK
jgi:hypothetical protein